MFSVKRSLVWRGKATQVEVRAEFTNPPWGERITLNYYDSIDAFATDYLIRNEVFPGKHQFKFIVDGRWVCSSLHPRCFDSSGIENNYIELDNSTFDSERPPTSEEIDETGNFLIKMRSASRGKTSDNLLSEDACFISERKSYCAVADGVGSWRSKGLVPSKFSNELVSLCLELSRKHSELTADVLIKISTDAYDQTVSFGSSTLILASVVNSYLHYYSIGDSRVVVLRLDQGDYQIAFMLRKQQHSFNIPYQLTNLPSKCQFEELRNSGFRRLVRYLDDPRHRIIKDAPTCGITGSLELHKQDLVLIGTDGLFDNLFRTTIEEVVNQAKASQPEDLAQCVANRLLKSAYERSIDPFVDTPFEKAAKKHGRLYTGGKPDDITVIVLLASSN